MGRYTSARTNLILAVIFGLVFIFGLAYLIIFLNVADQNIIQRNTFWIQFAFMFIPVSAALFTFTLTQYVEELDKIEAWKNHVRSQKQLLKTLDIFRLQVSSARAGHLEEFKKSKDSIPSYFIPTFNALQIASKIDSKINGRNTTLYKKLLIEMQVKIDTINRLLELVQNAHILKNKKEQDDIMKELRKYPGYYSDLNKMIEDEMWQIWLKFIVRKD